MSRHAAEQPPAAGDLLVSHPLLRRDVVLLLSTHDDGGYAFGLVTDLPPQPADPKPKPNPHFNPNPNSHQVTNAPTSATLGAGQMLSRGRDGGGDGGGGGDSDGGGGGGGMWTTGNRKLDGAGETNEFAPLVAARRVRDNDISPFAEHTIFYGGPDGKQQ
jgi:hypothetical protein